MKTKKMKRTIIALVFAFTISMTAFAQPVSGNLRPSFSAVVVKDMTVSAKWYESVLKLNPKSTMSDDKGGYKVVILASAEYTLELLELKGSMATTQVLEGKAEGTKIQGHFKIGFTVKDMDVYLKHLSSLGIKVPQVWTDQETRKRNFMITDPDGNLLQFFE